MGRDNIKEAYMQITIPLPRCDIHASTYEGFGAYLKQLELAVHHAQKSIQNAEKDGIELTEDSYITFKNPIIRSSMEIDIRENGPIKDVDVFMDNYHEELQHVELEITLV